MTLTVLDLFSGIGGFSLGLENAGMETVAFCETNEFCRKVLAKHWPSVPCYGDIRELTGAIIEKEVGPIDLISGGFPCQPFSQAGKQQGVADDRYLWPEMFRIIREVRPRWVLGENVAGIVKLALDQVLADLESLGYACQSFVIPACAVDAPHQRKRVWIVAHHSEHGRGSRGQGRSDPSSPRQPEQALQDVAYSAGSKRPRNRAKSGWEQSRLANEGRWLPEPNVGRVAHGVSNRVHRLRALGNAVVPGVVEMIGRAIIDAE